MTLTFENEQDFDLGFDPEEVAAAVINGVLDQEACPYEAEVEPRVHFDPQCHPIL